MNYILLGLLCTYYTITAMERVSIHKDDNWIIAHSYLRLSEDFGIVTTLKKNRATGKIQITCNEQSVYSHLIKWEREPKDDIIALLKAKIAQEESRG